MTRLHKTVLLLACSVWFSFVCAAESATSSATPAPAASHSTGIGGAWFGLVTLSLLLVLAAIVLWLYRRNVLGNKAGGGIQVLASQSLGPRERVLVLRVQDRILVLGHTPSQINLLTELESFETPDLESPELSSGFARQLQALLARGPVK